MSQTTLPDYLLFSQEELKINMFSDFHDVNVALQFKKYDITSCLGP